MTPEPEHLKALLGFLVVLLTVIGGILLASAFGTQKSRYSRLIVLGLGVVCVILINSGNNLSNTPQAQQDVSWLQNTYLTLGFGSVFSIATVLFFTSNQHFANNESSEIEIRKQLLNAVKEEVYLRLKYSLPEGAKIPTNSKIVPEQVGQPKLIPSLVQRTLNVFGGQLEISLEPTKQLIEVFEQDDIQGKLLILGAPGSGKTIELLNLAEALRNNASNPEQAPVPVIFELSAWKGDQSIAHWLASELKVKYNLSESIALKWLKTDELLPLLDGLDELKELKDYCIEAINQFQQKYNPKHLVICSRLEDYEKCETKLNLKGAVCLKHLNNEQIENYLKQRNCPQLWKPLKEDPQGFLELAKKPLLLNLMPVAYSEGLIKKGQRFKTKEERQKYQEECLKNLFNAYIERKLEQYSNNQYYKNNDTKRWLIWLAKVLKKQNQTEFLIEKIQPELLESSQKKWYRMIVGLILGLILGLSGALSGALIFGLSWGLIVRMSGGLSGGLIVGLIVGGIKINPTETLSWSWKRARRGLVFGLIVGLIFGLSGGLIVGLLFGLSRGLIFGLIFGVNGGQIVGLIFGLIGDEIKIRSRPNEGIEKSAKNTVVITLIILSTTGLLYFSLSLVLGITLNPSMGVVLGLDLALSASLLFGGLPVIQHIVLRFLLWRNKAIPWNYARFLTYAAERGLLKQTGGSYRFYHDLLREHFAQMND